MPGSRRMRLQAILFILLIMVILYVTTAKRSTYSSPFYTRTMAAIKERQNAESKSDMLVAEERRNDRVARIQDEHEIAMGNAKPDTPKQKPIVTNVKDAVAGKVENAKEKVEAAITGVLGEDPLKPLTGKKTAKDDRVVVNDNGKGTDGVAKVGNVEPKEKGSTADSSTESEEDRKADAEINSILKKGPIIIFSKSYCPHSKKAKNILQNMYTIVPPPFVVELDEHTMGPQLQKWLGKSTGRSTVPNVMVNGKSIGGGDDIQRLHSEGKLIESIQSLGGKRIVEISSSDGKPVAPKGRVRRRA